MHEAAAHSARQAANTCLTMHNSIDASRQILYS